MGPTIPLECFCHIEAMFLTVTSGDNRVICCDWLFIVFGCCANEYDTGFMIC